LIAVVSTPRGHAAATPDPDVAFRGVTVSKIEVIQRWERKPVSALFALATPPWQAAAPDLLLQLRNDAHTDLNEDHVRGRVWLRIDGKPYRLWGIARFGGTSDAMGLRMTIRVNLCHFYPPEVFQWPGSPACSGRSQCWELAAGAHELQACVRGGSCSVPISFRWSGHRETICP